MIKIDGELVSFKGSDKELLNDFIKLHLAMANNKKLMEMDLDALAEAEKMINEKDSYTMKSIDIGKILKKIFDEEN